MQGLVLGLRHLPARGQVDPELERVCDQTGHGILVVDNPSTCGHPLGVARVEQTLVAGTIGMLDASFENKGYRFDAAMRVFPENIARHEVFGHEDERVGGSDVASVNQAPGAMPLDASGLELGLDDPGNISREQRTMIEHLGYLAGQ